jgi:uncharacterized repeat protein (TIGR02543 family)
MNNIFIRLLAVFILYIAISCVHQPGSSSNNDSGSNSSPSSASYTVTLDSQGATTPASPSSLTVTYPATTISALPADPVKTGYLFGGWFTAINGGGAAFNTSTTVSSNITVYALWNSYTYTVTFNPSGAGATVTPTQKTVSSPATTLNSVPTPIRTGYLFLGWYTSTNGNGTYFDNNTTVTKNITVYAYWDNGI